MQYCVFCSRSVQVNSCLHRTIALLIYQTENCFFVSPFKKNHKREVSLQNYLVYVIMRLKPWKAFNKWGKWRNSKEYWGIYYFCAEPCQDSSAASFLFELWCVVSATSHVTATHLLCLLSLRSSDIWELPKRTVQSVCMLCSINLLDCIKCFVLEKCVDGKIKLIINAYISFQKDSIGVRRLSKGELVHRCFE